MNPTNEAAHETAREATPWILDRRLRSWIRVVLVLSCAATIVALIAEAMWSPKIPFLSSDSRADWILYPLHANNNMREKDFLRMSTDFEREFTIATVPVDAQLHLRAFREFRVWLNEKELVTSSASHPNWKRTTSIPISEDLHVGANRLRVRVACEFCAPALQLFTTGLERNLRTNTDWYAFTKDQPRAHATPADEYMTDPLFPEAPKVPDSIARHARTLLTTFVIFALLSWLHDPTGKLASRIPFPRIPSLSPRAVLWLAISLWAIVFLNNTPRLYPGVGFDALSHLFYINFVVKEKAIPLAHEGFSTYHPPLFYVLSGLAFTYLPKFWSMWSYPLIFKLIPFLCGLGEIGCAYFASKLLFRDHPSAQIACIVFAAMLPMNIYMSHFISNETLSAVLITLSLAFTLYILQRRLEFVRDFFVLGLILGLALLTKLTCLMIIPLLLAALVWSALSSHQLSLRALTSRIALTCVVTLAVCGWYYYRNFSVYGKPFIANWEPAIAQLLWWQDPGFHIASHFFQFGSVFSNPYFVGFFSFFDALYATFWGDGLIGGQISFKYLPPWNYEYMSAIYGLAIPAAMILLIGFVIVARKAFAELDTPWMLLFGVFWLSLFALIHMNLKLPYYGMAKAFYCLYLTVPCGIAFALGLEHLSTHLRGPRLSIARHVLHGYLGCLGAAIFLAFYSTTISPP